MNPNDLFWLAQYAFNTINPLVKVDERLKIDIEFHGSNAGVSVWIHSTACSHVNDFEVGLTKWQDVEAFANQLKARAEALV